MNQECHTLCLSSGKSWAIHANTSMTQTNCLNSTGDQEYQTWNQYATLMAVMYLGRETDTDSEPKLFLLKITQS